MNAKIIHTKKVYAKIKYTNKVYAKVIDEESTPAKIIHTKKVYAKIKKTKKIYANMTAGEENVPNLKDQENRRTQNHYNAPKCSLNNCTQK